jgi:hypothetical protein
MTRSAKEAAAEITRRSSGTGMRAGELFDHLVEAAHHSCAMTAPTSQEQVDRHFEGFRRVQVWFADRGIAAAEFADIVTDFLDAVEHGSSDFLGDVAAQLSTLDGGLGQFFTPFEVSRLVCAIDTTDDDLRDVIRRHGFASMHEPTAGSGGMILAFAERIQSLQLDPALTLYVECNELETTAFHMLYTQLSCRGVSALCRLGDTLSQEFREELHTPAYVQRFAPHQVERARWSKLLSLVA